MSNVSIIPNAYRHAFQVYTRIQNSVHHSIMIADMNEFSYIFCQSIEFLIPELEVWNSLWVICAKWTRYDNWLILLCSFFPVKIPKSIQEFIEVISVPLWFVLSINRFLRLCILIRLQYIAVGVLIFLWKSDSSHVFYRSANELKTVN